MSALVAVLAGGRGRRMGGSKALAELDGVDERVVASINTRAQLRDA